MIFLAIPLKIKQTIAGMDKMGYLYCPNCSKGVSELAEIIACPNCYHPFKASVWRDIFERKQAEEEKKRAEAEKKRVESERQVEEWRKAGLCTSCGGKMTRSYNESSWDRIHSDYSYYCSKCGRYK